MGRIKQAKPSPAFVVAVVALVAAVCGGAVAGVAVRKLDQNEKKQVRKISKNQASKLDKKIELTPGPKGEQGDPGSHERDAALRPRVGHGRCRPLHIRHGELRGRRGRSRRRLLRARGRDPLPRLQRRAGGHDRLVGERLQRRRRDRGHGRARGGAVRGPIAGAARDY